MRNRSEHDAKLYEFIKLLRAKLHESNPNSLIWYDSVTIEGKLQRQSKLNELNCKFFEMTDTFFQTIIGKYLT